MPRLILILILFFAGTQVQAQSLSLPEILKVVNMEPALIDTLMKQRRFVLFQKEKDSVSQLKYYTSVERNPEATSWVRSLSYMEAELGDYKGRMVTYRTYSKEEYTQWMSWLLENGYRTEKSYTAGTDHHTLYSNGKTKLRVMNGVAYMPQKRKTRIYEVESGL
jgi:hypothetical protein